MYNKFAKNLTIIILFIIFIIGLTFVITSYLSLGLVNTKINIFTIDGNANFLTEGVLLKTRFIGIALIFIGFIYISIMEKVQQFLSKIFIASYSFFKEILGKFNKAFRVEDKFHTYSFIVIIIIAIVMRIFFLFRPICYEEAFMFLNYAQKPLFMGLSDYSYSSNCLFNTLLVHISYKLFGNNLCAIRLPALIFGILIIPMTYMTARMFYNKNTAVLSAGIIASSSILIEYSTNAMGLTIICFFSMTILVLVKYLSCKHNLFAWLLLAVFSALGFYTNPNMFYPFGVVMTWFLLSFVFKDTKFSRIYLFKKVFLFLITTIILTFILYTPIMIRSGLKSIINNKFVESLPWWHAFSLLPSSVNLIWNQWNRDIPTMISIFFVIGFIMSLLLHKKIANYKVPIISAVFIYCIPLFLLQRNIPSGPVWLFLLPICIILSSAGITFLLGLILLKIKNYKSIIFPILSLILSIGLGILVFCSQSVCYSNKAGTLQDAEEIAIVLEDHLKAGDKVLSKSPSDAILIYYFKKHNISVDYFDLSSDLSSSKHVFIVVNKNSGQKLDEIFDSCGSSVLLYSNPKLFKEYESAYIYKTYNLKFKSRLIFDFNDYAKGEFQNSRLSKDNKEIIIGEGKQKLKLCKMPITIESDKDYIISFKIKKVKDLNNVISFDFFGEGYDRPEQEFSLKSTDIGKDFKQVNIIINSGEVPYATKIYFRIFTYADGGAIIRELEIYDKS